MQCEKRFTRIESKLGKLDHSVALLDQRVNSLEKTMERLVIAFSSFKKWVFVAVWTTFALTVAVLTLYTGWIIYDSNRNYSITMHALEKINEHSLQIQRLEITRSQNLSDK